jgi:DNA-binding NarL/FixJ family response regulator
MARTRVLLADDSAMIAAQIRELLERAYEVVGVVASGEDLESAFEALEPEVVVADIVMPGKGGLAAVRHIQDRHPGTPVVFLSVIAAPSMIRMSLASGHSAYVVKDDAADELVPAIEAAREGRDYVSSTGRRALSWT